MLGYQRKKKNIKIPFASGKDVVNLTVQVQFAMLVYDDFQAELVEILNVIFF